jgi:hypothetical protein
MGILDFVARSPRPDFNAAIATVVLSEMFLRSVEGPFLLDPVWANERICGVALLLDRQSESLHPTVLVDGSVAGSIRTFETIRQFPVLVGAIERLLGAGTEWSSRMRVMGVTEFAEQLRPGDTISATARGVVGCGVRWSNRYGFLTAGHVASISVNVLFGGNQVGTVVYSNNPAGHGLKIEEDVAVV